MQVRAICYYCGKNIYLNVEPEHINDSKGGIFRVAANHVCNGTNKIVLLFVDQDLSVRGMEICPLVSSEEK